jgi:hypothetical protein
MKRMAAVAALVMGFMLGACQAQFLGYVSPQTETQSFGTQTCTGSAQIFSISNLGQTQHYLQFSSITGATQFQAQLYGFDAAGNSYAISDAAFAPGLGHGALLGSGYWAQIKAFVTCSPNTATYVASYTGAWATSNVDAGSYLASQVDKIMFSGSSEASNQLSGLIQTPFGASGGLLLFQYSAAGAGGSLVVGCQGGLAFGTQTIATFTLANTTTLQTFAVPNFPCIDVSVQYNTNGTTGTISAEYELSQPGAFPLATQYRNISTNASTQVKTGPGVLHLVAVNNIGTAETLTIFDNTSCTGTTIAALSAVSGPESIGYDVQFFTGLCVTSAGTTAGNFTISFQ